MTLLLQDQLCRIQSYKQNVDVYVATGMTLQMRKFVTHNSTCLWLFEIRNVIAILRLVFNFASINHQKTALLFYIQSSAFLRSPSPYFFLSLGMSSFQANTRYMGNHYEAYSHLGTSSLPACFQPDKKMQPQVTK